MCAPLFLLLAPHATLSATVPEVRIGALFPIFKTEVRVAPLPRPPHFSFDRRLSFALRHKVVNNLWRLLCAGGRVWPRHFWRTPILQLLPRPQGDQ